MKINEERKLYDAKTKRYYVPGLALNEAKEIIALYKDNNFKVESIIVHVEKSWFVEEEETYISLKFSK